MFTPIELNDQFLSAGRKYLEGRGIDEDAPEYEDLLVMFVTLAKEKYAEITPTKKLNNSE